MAISIELAIWDYSNGYNYCVPVVKYQRLT